MTDSTPLYPWKPLDNREACCVPKPLIEVRDLSLFYRDKPAFKEVSLNVNTGCITALVGPSGCGKTSFLSCLNRMTDLIPGARLKGEITVSEESVLESKTDVLELRKRIGMIFQKPNPFPLSIRRNLEFPLKEHGVRDREELESRVETSLKDVGLWREVRDRLDQPALGLSGGQQQRLCIARALVLQPEALLMDEPCSALDPISSGVVEDLIASFRKRVTVLIVTHNLAQARRISDYVAFFWVQDGAGRLIEQGPAKALFETPRHELTAAYVGGMRG